MTVFKPSDQRESGRRTGKPRRKKNSRQRRRDAALSSAGRCYAKLYGSRRGVNVWAAVASAVNDKDLQLLNELRRASENAVRCAVGHVPGGAEFAGHNALVEQPWDVNPILGLARRFERGQGRGEIEEAIRKKVDEMKKPS